MTNRILVTVVLFSLIVACVIGINYFFRNRVEVSCDCEVQSSCPTGCFRTRFEALIEKKKVISDKELADRKQAQSNSLSQRKGHLLSEAESTEQIMSFDELWSRGEELIDTVVKVRGQITTGSSMCTEIGCPKNNPYCNTCTYYYALMSPSQPKNKIEIKSMLYGFIGCYGGDPTKSLNCQPLELNKTYVIKGWLRKGSVMTSSGFHLEYLGHFSE